ncbi:MAG TPA: LuxR C-terminal-related transcriptional regulator [Pseudorhodoferax sp.]|nr:LuxR C-terminal-related transcriptional regulator [Pseudorhodoferax sp.]
MRARPPLAPPPVREPVFASTHEQECLLRAAEAGLAVRNRHQLFLWVRGQVQALLPHAMLVCAQTDCQGRLLHCDCLHAGVPDTALLQRLLQPEDGVVARLAQLAHPAHLAHCAGGGAGLPLGLDAGAPAAPLAALLQPLHAQQLGHALLHGSGPVRGEASLFLLLGMPHAPTAREAYFLDLLLPYLHLAWQRVRAAAQPVAAPAVTAREDQVLRWLREGKSNAEIAALLGISALTVKSHLQQIYRKLRVHNRTQAAAAARAAAHG